MAKPGWDIKSAGAVLNIHPNKVTQSIGPAFKKVARLMIADPVKTWRELQEAMDEEEIDLRARALEGRADRTELTRS